MAQHAERNGGIEPKRLQRSDHRVAAENGAEPGNAGVRIERRPASRCRACRDRRRCAAIASLSNWFDVLIDAARDATRAGRRARDKGTEESAPRRAASEIGRSQPTSKKTRCVSPGAQLRFRTRPRSVDQRSAARGSKRMSVCAGDDRARYRRASRCRARHEPAPPCRRAGRARAANFENVGKVGAELHAELRRAGSLS